MIATLASDRGAVDWVQARRLSGDVDTRTNETVSLADAVGRVLAVQVAAATDIPHYASSAMDGWAVCGPAPWRLVGPGPLAVGQGAIIVTGGLIPAGTHGVLRSENGIVAGALLTCAPTARANEPHAGQHIRPAGEEARAQDVLIARGTVLNPAHISVAAACCRDELEVVGLPRVALLLTGDEVDVAGVPLPGRVRDSFGPQLPAVISMLGGQVIQTRRVEDDLRATIDALTAADQAAEVIVTTGGTGRSAADHLRSALEILGARIVVDGVAMRPGSPSLLAQLPNGSWVVSLPGNPLAAMMGVITLVEPLLASLGGRLLRPTGRVGLAEDMPGREATTLLLPYRCHAVEDNARGFASSTDVAVATMFRGSGMMRGLADAAGVLVIPPEGASGSAESLPLPWT